MKENVMMLPIEISKEFVDSYQALLLDIARESVDKVREGFSEKEYMNKKEASEYIGISFNTFQKLERMGLPVIEIDSVMLVKRQDIDEFLNAHKSVI